VRAALNPTVAADVAALKAAFRNWPVDGVVKIGVADKVTV
jgi:hypothetical protein